MITKRFPSRLLRFTIAVLILLLLGCDRGAKQPEESRQIPIVYPVSVDALLKIGEGVDESLRKQGWKLRAFSAEGDPDKFSSAIESAFALKSPVVISVGTQVTNTALGPKYSKSRPALIAAAIFDPNKLETLANGGIAPPRQINIAIISDKPAGTGRRLIDLLRKFFPKARKLGILTNKAELNSVASADEVAVEAEAVGMTVQRGYVTGPADVDPVTRTLLAGGVDALIIPHDKAAVAQASTVVNLGLRSNKSRPIPTLSLDDGTVEKHGALAGVSADYKAIGRHAGRLALDAIAGRSLRDVAVVYPSEVIVIINRTTASGLNIPMPSDLDSDVRFVE